MLQPHRLDELFADPKGFRKSWLALIYLKRLFKKRQKILRNQLIFCSSQGIYK